ncbi:hypothetical protein B0H16DRAFT_1798029 [Mycena metata]|uniref:Siderophore iron transporter n=1 Tax=Mycena metata TaxID=1033252 RepID=A0AAD7JH30_9AGAR|nr:hypothetical protein B0H16DRAFT_1798029 [Mycena metata]
MSVDIQQTLCDEKALPDENNTPPTLDKESGVVDDQQDGVTKIEAFYLVFSKGWSIWMLYTSLALISFLLSLSSTTTATYEIFAASSFKSHSLIGAIAVVISITSGISRPFIAKIADLSSRPLAMSGSMLFYTVGYIVVASSITIEAVAGGEVIYRLGSTGIDLISNILLADITSLQWRGAVQGLNSMPSVITAFIAGKIATAISANTLNGWRWGMEFILFWGNRKAKKIRALSLASPSYARRTQLRDEQPQSRWELYSHYWRLIDAFGLLLLGAGFALILLPFTLHTRAHNGWKNSSLIAMFVIGGVLLTAFGIWETKLAAHPMMPRRVINRTFICCILINFMTFVSSSISLTYFSSYVYVVKDWSLTNYTYFNNIFGLICFCSSTISDNTLVDPPICGLCIRVIGQGLMFLAVRGNKSDAVLVMSQILLNFGAAISIICSSVALQACVPHQDMALVISLLTLSDSLADAIGGAICAAIWTAKLPQNLEKYLGDTLNSTQLAKIYGSVAVAREAQPRELVIQAYDDTNYYLFLLGLCICTLCIPPACFTTNFYLGTTHNAVESKEVRLRDRSETDEEVIKREAAQIEARFEPSDSEKVGS